MRRWGLTICLGSLVWFTPAAAADPLPSFAVDLAESSVSGLSSGAYMAGQFHVAFSGSLNGAAIIAGGPYGCARGQLPLALSQCMQTSFGAPDPAALQALAEDLEQRGRIDPLAISSVLEIGAAKFSARKFNITHV